MKTSNKKVVIRTSQKTFFLGFTDIMYCKAAGAYSVIYLTNGEQIITSNNLSKLFSLLSPLCYIYRICQSYLINTYYIKCIHHATKEVELHNNIMVPYTISIKDIEEALNSI